MSIHNPSPKISRRAALVGASALALPFAKLTAAPRQLDLLNPEIALEAFAKLRGSTQTKTVYQVYQGDVFLAKDQHVQEPLVGFQGIQKANWYREGSQQHRSVDFDLGLYVDPKSRQVLNEWHNPFTGKTVPTLHYRSGPAEQTHSLKKDEKGAYGSFSRGWRVVGDKVAHDSGGWGKSPNTILPPKEYPLGSSGENLFFSSTYTMIGRVSELTDPKITMAPCSYTWTMLASWPPWMEMGQLSGNVMWRWIGHKVMVPSDIDPALIQAVERVWPGYMTDEAPWQDASSGWQQYKWLKDGHKPK